jgi:hypothetical protein
MFVVVFKYELFIFCDLHSFKPVGGVIKVALLQ